MNIENISALAAQLQSLGFENQSSALLKRICFRPDNFILTQKIMKSGDQFLFHLLIEKDSLKNSYSLRYYDVTLQKESVSAVSTLNGINPIEIESRMAELDWRAAFDFDVKKQWNPADKTSWEKELKVDAVIEALQQLETDDEGKLIASGLKLKYWAGLAYQEIIGNISPVKNRLDVSQRFYLSEGQPGISVDEAYRFLQNKWLEKQIQMKKKIADVSETGGTGNDGHVSSGSGLLKKKRFSGTKSGRKSNLVRS